MPFQPKLDNTRLLVTDFAACLEFYKTVFGLELPPGHGFPYVEFQTAEGKFALFDRGFMAGAIGAADLPAQAAPSQDRVALIFEVESVDEAHAELTGKGVQFIAPPTDRKEWMIRTAHLRDPDGNLVELFQNSLRGD